MREISEDRERYIGNAIIVIVDAQQAKFIRVGEDLLFEFGISYTGATEDNGCDQAWLFGKIFGLVVTMGNNVGRI